MLHKKTISSNYNQNKKTDENRKKTTKIGLACNFYETKLHRGRKRR